MQQHFPRLEAAMAADGDLCGFSPFLLRIMAQLGSEEEALTALAEGQSRRRVRAAQQALRAACLLDLLAEESGEERAW